MKPKMDEYIKQHGFAEWFETSARDNVNIEESAKFLVNEVGIEGHKILRSSAS